MDTYNTDSAIEELLRISFGVADTHLQENSRDKCLLTLYLVKYEGEMDLDSFYRCSNERYKLLQIVSDMGDCEGKELKKWLNACVKKLVQFNLGDFYRIITERWEEGDKMRLTEWDIASHYSLRATCSRLYESLKWFIKQEVKLLHIRWNLLNDAQRRDFLLRSNISMPMVPPSERLEMFKITQRGSIINNLYKTRFTDAPELLKTKRCYLHQGWMYFKFIDSVYPIADWYQRYLDISCRSAKKCYHHLIFDERIAFLYQRISDEIRHSLFSFSSSGISSIKLSDLNRVSSDYFPLCMEVLHYNLMRHNHLRNGGRLQYNLFLKGIGVSLTDAIKFWRDIFTKRMTIQSFTRHYLYSIRHNYGKLGKQADYPPLSCSRILEATPGPLDYHGCPYKTSHKDTLNKHLKRNQITEQGVEEIWDLVEQNVPQQACAKFFELRYGVRDEAATLHPNIYFNKSSRLKRARPENECSRCSASDGCRAADW